MESPSNASKALPESQFNVTIRRSRPRMTRFERSKIISMRAEQIANGTVPFVDKLDGDRPIDVAEREFAAGRVPFIIRRFVKNVFLCVPTVS